MGIDVAYSAPKQRMVVDEMENLRVRGDACMGQAGQRVQHDFALTQIAQGKFADDKGVRQDRSRIEQRGEGLVAHPQMLDPDRRIDQDHIEPDRRRGGAFRPDSLPPRRANRRALSRSMSALSASRTRLDFSFKPVKA